MKLIVCGSVVLFLVGTMGTANAYDRYSTGTDTNCAKSGCHGGFTVTPYVPPSGPNWSNSLHSTHQTQVNNNCFTCHVNIGAPVLLASSTGVNGLDPISCMGCHGRAEDNAGNPESPNGSGAGLRQAHTNAGVAECSACHSDATTAAFTPVGEDVLPPYYASGLFNIPTSSCTGEDVAGTSDGLDNDGDGNYDLADTDCMPSPDAGVPDAGMADAGVPDASIPDAMISLPDAAIVPDAAISTPDAAVLVDDAAVPVDDAAVAVDDAAVGVEDAATAAPDATLYSPDAAGPDDDDEEEAGCGCRSGNGSPPYGAGLIALFVIGMLVTRRRSA